MIPEETRHLTSFDYRDGLGNLLFQVVRRQPKKFSQRRPDGRGVRSILPTSKGPTSSSFLTMILPGGSMLRANITA